MAVTSRKRYPDYEKRVTVGCLTLKINMLTGGAGSGRTRITVLLDEGLESEREVEWDYAEDHPVFIFREPRGK